MNVLKKLRIALSRRRAERRAAKNEKRYKSWLNSLTPPPGADVAALRLVYTDKEENNYYVFADPLSMSVERSEKIAEAVAASSYSVEKKDIIEVVAAAMTAITAGDMKKLKTETLTNLADLRHRMDRIGVEALILDIAVLFFLTDNEDPYQVNPLVTADKRRRALVDADLRAFFLLTIWDLYGKHEQTSGAALLRYIEKTKIVEGLSAHLRRP